MWTDTNIILDPDKPNVGMVSATWNKGQDDEFTFVDRGIMTIAGRDAFIVKAKAALAAHASKSTNEVTYESNLLTALNA